jgi:hypothetical protein
MARNRSEHSILEWILSTRLVLCDEGGYCQAEEQFSSKNVGMGTLSLSALL